MDTMPGIQGAVVHQPDQLMKRLMMSCGMRKWVHAHVDKQDYRVGRKAPTSILVTNSPRAQGFYSQSAKENKKYLLIVLTVGYADMTVSIMPIICELIAQ